MPVIDADTHINETEDTWGFLSPDEQAWKPGSLDAPSHDPSRPPNRFWLIDGKRRPRPAGDDQLTRTTAGMRELFDVPARLGAMDEMGVDVQVIYPTLFLSEGTENPAVDLALRRSYNRWMAVRCAESKGRLRWVCLPTMLDMDRAIDELRFAKDHGACGVLKKGDIEAGFWPNHEYFFPLYEEAQRLDLPICFHLGTGEPKLWPARDHSTVRFYRLQLSVVQAFHAMLLHGIPRAFPSLRFGFVEADASWLPFLLYDLKRRMARPNSRGPANPLRADAPETLLQENRMYVSCQVDEDLPYIMQCAGEDNLMIGSDFTHPDAAMEMDFPRLLQERVSRGEISSGAAQKILYDNPRAFYGL
jgi:predicted TIM-barrel fold metal-dependent hydrolase